MKANEFDGKKIIGILREHAAGVRVSDPSRKYGVSENTLHKWRAKYGVTDVSEAKRLRELEAENAKRRRLLRDSMRENVALKDVLSKKW